MWNRESSKETREPADKENREPPKDERERPPQVLAPPVPVRQPDERRAMAWLGKSVLFRGDLISLEDMTIDGRVEGTIELRNHNLTIGPDANIQADIVAKALTIFGAVTGKITASDTIDIRESGSIEGDVTARRLSMADGAVVRGRVETGARESDPKHREAQKVGAS